MVRSLRFKLSWTHGLIIAVVIASIGVVRYQTISFRARRNFDQHLLTDARVLISCLEVGPDSFRIVTRVLSPSDTMTLEELIQYVVVTDRNGRVVRPDLHSRYMQQMLIQGRLAGILEKTMGFGTARATDGTKFQFANLLRHSYLDGNDYVVHVGRSMESLSSVLEESVLMYIYSAPLVLALSVIIGWYLAGRALRPFEEIARTAQQITSNNLNTRIESHNRETEVQQLVQSFNAMVSRLDESFEQMRKFNADAAHELRTPLAILQGETEVALRSPSVPEEIRTVLASNLEELDRLTRIVNDMLTLAEAEAGHQVLSKKPVNLKPLLEDLVEQMRLLASDRNIRMEIRYLQDAIVDADELWMRRAFLNLLDNAIKYSKDGGFVEIQAAVQNESVNFYIQDDGIGISAEDLPHIFDRLYRADKARNRSSGGAGLGLALVKWVVESHEGTIQVSSRPDQGTKFELAFPISRLGTYAQTAAVASKT